MLNKVAQYIKESYVELRRVVWPSRRQTIEHTAAVIGISLAVAAFLGLIDYLLTIGLEKIIIR